MTTTKTKWKHWHTWAILVCIALIIIISLIPRKVSDSDTTDMQPKVDSVLNK